jgi:hypothetical protein
LWDKDITAYIRKESPMFWEGGWTNIVTISRGMQVVDGFDPHALYQQETESFRAAKTVGELQKKPKYFEKFFDEWALEAAQYACKNVYTDPVSRKEITHNFSISDQDLKLWKDNMLQRMLTAGARSGLLINMIVENKPVESFRDTSKGLEVKHREDVQLELELGADLGTNHNTKSIAFGKHKGDWKGNLGTTFCPHAK